MLNKYILFLTLLVSAAYSKRQVHFKLIAFGTSSKVEIVGDKIYDLTRGTTTDPYYSAKIQCPDGDFQYKYIVDNVPESFTRTLSKSTSTTFNEFYGREETVKELGHFQYPENHWKRSIGRTSLFDDSYIPTIHFSGKNVEKFFHDPRASIKAERVSIYLKDSKKSFMNVPISAKNKNFDKFQIRMSLSKKANIKNRYLLKFRNGSEDPINLRQTIYGNINQAIGIPSIHSVMVRVYYNNKPAGFYTLQEEAYSESFIRAEFYGNEQTGEISDPPAIGDTFDCSTGADFEYQPYNISFYNPIAPKIGKGIDKVVAFTKALSELDTTNEEAVSDFDKKWFDIETFHKAMAMEYLTADWDGYWYFTSNFAFYNDPTESTDSTYKFYFITQDHDETFGVGLTPEINTVGVDFPKVSYTTMLNKTWHGDDFDAFRRTLVDKFISGSPQLQKRFQDTLISIVQHVFNPVAFRKVVQTYFDRFRPEAEWDYSFKRPYAPRHAQIPNWKYDDFLNGFENPLPGIPWGLYQWVQLRSEAIKQEFCITWENDTNPPSESCVPYEIPGLKGEEKPTSEVVVTSTEIEVPTATTEVEVTTTIGEYETSTLTEYETETQYEEYTSTVYETMPEPTKTPEPEKPEPTKTAEPEKPKPTTKPTKQLPSKKGTVADWFKGKKPKDFGKKQKRSIIRRVVVKKSKIHN